MTRDELRARLRAAALEVADVLADVLAATVESGPPVSAVEVYTVRTLAAALHRSSSTVRAWVQEGEFEGAVKVGKGWLVPAGAVRTFLDRRRTVAPRTDAAPSAPIPSQP